MTANTDTTTNPNKTTATPKSSWMGTPAEQLKMFGWVTLFSAAIGVLLDSIGMSQSLSSSIVIATTVGWCIFVAHGVIGWFLEARLGSSLTSGLATLVGLCVAMGLIAAYLTATGTDYEFLDWGSLATVLFFGPLGSLLFTNLSNVREMRTELSEAALEQSETERALTDAKLKTLQAQIEPHFLFNTLSNAKGLIRTDPTAAEETLQQLTTLLRHSLSRTREQTTTVQQELELVRAYLRINQIRMGDRLTFEVTSDAETDQQSLPPLLVQPLVENAISHGLEPAEAGGTVKVLAKMADGNLHIEVRDTGLGLSTNNSTSGTGTGLANVRARLHSLYGQNARARLRPNDPQGVVADITLPLTARDATTDE